MNNLLANGTVLITGGAGFIGSNFIPFLLNKNPNVIVINLDKLTYAGNLKNLIEINAHPNYTFVEGDICDYSLINKIFKDYNINGVINFAAESHVDNSIDSPSPFIKTNIEGTFNLLEVARKHWKGKEYRFHHISTDEVYGSLPEEGYFTEESNYQPNSPYSASKASSDFLVRSYHHTYGMNVVTSNCSNNYGPKQHDEKLIPTVIRSITQGDKVPVYGTGKNIREWIHAEDHAKAIIQVLDSGGEQIYNIPGSRVCNNLKLIEEIIAVIEKHYPEYSRKVQGSVLHRSDYMEFVADRKGHDFKYQVSTKHDLPAVKNQKKFDLSSTVKYYVEKYTAYKRGQVPQLKAY